jgi:hypothetical protein
MSGRVSEFTSASVRPDARDRLWSNSLVPERVKGRRRCVRRSEIESPSDSSQERSRRCRPLELVRVHAEVRLRDRQRLAVDTIKGVKHIAAKLAHFDGAYLRFAGDIEISRYRGDALVETHKDDAIWELMYFGHARDE